MSYIDILNADIRFIILQALQKDNDYTLNELILMSVLRTMGHGVSTDKLHTELAWLAEQNLISVEDHGGIQVARILTRGDDVATGRAQCPGVRRPKPGEVT